MSAEAAARLGAPLLHLSTDYVFDGALDRPYREDDPTGPTGAYGRSKLAGEKRVAERCPNSVILRTAWVYSPFGANFVRTMLQTQRNARRGRRRRRPARRSDVGARHRRRALAIAAGASGGNRLRPCAGVFHMTGAGEATWAEFAEAMLPRRRRGGRQTRVKRIATADYPTPARRPANSRLDNEKLSRVYGVRLPDGASRWPSHAPGLCHDRGAGARLAIATQNYRGSSCSAKCS